MTSTISADSLNCYHEAAGQDSQRRINMDNRETVKIMNPTGQPQGMEEHRKKMNDNQIGGKAISENHSTRDESEGQYVENHDNLVLRIPTGPPHGIEEPWKEMNIYQGTQNPDDHKSTDYKSSTSVAGNASGNTEKQLDQVVIEKMRQCLDEEENAIAKMRECLNEREKDIMKGTSRTNVPSEGNHKCHVAEQDSKEDRAGDTSKVQLEKTQNSRQDLNASKTYVDGDKRHTQETVNQYFQPKDDSLTSPERCNLDKLNERSEASSFGNVHEIIAQMRDFVEEEETARIGDEDHSKELHEKRMKDLEQNISESTRISDAIAAKQENEQNEENIERKDKHRESKSELKEGREDRKKELETEWNKDKKEEFKSSYETKSSEHDGAPKMAVTHMNDDRDEIIKMSNEKNESGDEDELGGSSGDHEKEKKKKEAKNFMKKMKGLLSTRD